MMGDFIFGVPDMYRAALASGDLIRFGTVIKDSTTGQIVAHLQESGIGSSLMSGLGGGPIGAVNMASSVFANVQISQLKDMMEVMQMLQIATLGVSVVGIGVSAIGFAMMNQKLNDIQSQIIGLSKQIGEITNYIEKRDLRAHFSKIKGLYERADQAHHSKNPTSEWLRIAYDMGDESAFFRDEIADFLSQPTFNSEMFIHLFRSFALCNAGRIECLMLSNELSQARQFSLAIARDYKSMFDGLTSVNLANKVVSQEVRWDYKSFNALRNEQLKMQSLVRDIRHDTYVVLTQPYLLETLIEQEIDGRMYINAIREEKNHPLLMLVVK